MKDFLGSSRGFKATFEGAPVGMVVKDAEGRLLKSNRAFQKMLGYGEEELRGMLRRNFIYPEDAEKDAELYRELLYGGGPGFQIEKRYVKKDGGIMWGRLSVSRIEGEEGERPFALGILEDVSELKRVEEASGVSERRFRAVVEQSPLSIHVFAPDGKSIRANESWNRLWYLDEGEEAEGANVFEDELLRVAGLLPYVEGGVSGVEAKIPPLLFDPARAGREGEPKWLEGVVYPLQDSSGEITEVTLMLDDVTGRKNMEETLVYRALHDTLTDLPNRTLFMDRLEQAFVRLERRPARNTGQNPEWDPERSSIIEAGRGGVPGRSSYRGVAVLFLDLDDLKRVNDSLGHEAGDRLLVEAAGRIGNRLRPADTLARFTGDEFVVLLEEVDEEKAARTSERILQGFDAPFSISGQEIFVTVSVGIALNKKVTAFGGRPVKEAGTLLRQADLAMYEAKKWGKARYVVYEERMGREAGARVKLEGDLRRALAREEIEVFYQPKVSLQSNQAVGVEALARWRHPEQGLLFPADFIPLAEETGLVVDLGYQVLRTALDQAARWREQWTEHRPDTESSVVAPAPVVWVNLSARQFHEPDLVRHISGILDEKGLTPDVLGLEITESILIEDAGPSVSLLKDLRRLGVKLAVDDFGTGYSSLSYLTRLPVDYLKIDRSFIAQLGPEPDDEIRDDSGSTTVISAIVGLARAMDMEVVAEGVETEGQLSRLRKMGCDLAQGYHFAGPLPVNEASAYLLQSRTGWNGASGYP